MHSSPGSLGARISRDLWRIFAGICLTPRPRGHNSCHFVMRVSWGYSMEKCVMTYIDMYNSILKEHMSKTFHWFVGIVVRYKSWGNWNHFMKCEGFMTILLEITSLESLLQLLGIRFCGGENERMKGWSFMFVRHSTFSSWRQTASSIKKWEFLLLPLRVAWCRVHINISAGHESVSMS